MRRVKILLLGDSNVGKTSIISRLTTGDFKNSLAHTVGVDYKAKKLHIDGEMLQSYERVAHWMVGIKKHASKDVHVLLVANKTDLRETSECKVPYVETSALTAENVEECLLTLVRSIVDDLSLSFPGPGSPPRLSLDFAAIAKSRESKDSNHSHGSGVSGDKKGEKCVVS
ncbi:rab1D [Symbiodinium microadriaticum]|nr:rab1D [Symbiodinium microadriaticum]